MARPRLIPYYAGALCLTAAVAAFALGEPARIADRPWLFLLLVACVLVLDAADVDLFGRGNFSPATVATIALACTFGVLGPVAAELAVATLSLARREPLLKRGFDLGALATCGVAAALVADVLPGATGWLLAHGVVAAAVYYLMNTLLLCGVWGLSEGIAPVAAWRERLAWAAPHYLAYGCLAGLLLLAERQAGLYVFAIAGLPMGLVWLGQQQYLDRTRDSVEELRRSHAELAEVNESLRGLLTEKQELLERVRRSYVSTVSSLARTIEAKDPYTGGHTERVADFAVELARELGLSGEELQAVAIGGVIHDIGKIGIRDQVLLKPGRLDPDEWAEMRRHPEISTYILDELELPRMAKEMARHHHERFDGGGYPDGLVGETIPLAARILAVADTIDAMTTDRPYRDALTLDATLAEVRKHAGTQFCPVVVAALEASCRRRPQLWAVASKPVPVVA
jgi:hypothetical protein